ncbi:hypothetical protein [Nocardiopsis ganjiahuensis]|uniref:hypothetical protein n=1 Tax=Nocardiopsis ganjiahuensis TaxID=239984 RepID=UPI0003451B5F|nr:hypothetical protein [Nocardiopsis ganjiahuensis]
MGVRSTTVTASLALLLCATLASCTADEAPEQEVDAALLELEQAADALSVTVLRPGAERAFARKGHPVDGSLSCTTAPPEPAEGDGDTVTAGGTEAGEDAVAQEPTEDAREARGGQLEVLCTGRSRDGEEIRFEGRLLREALAGREDGDDSLRGDFTGLVAGDEVFTMDCFQCSPAGSESHEDAAASDGATAPEADGTANDAE